MLIVYPTPTKTKKGGNYRFCRQWTFIAFFYFWCKSLKESWQKLILPSPAPFSSSWPFIFSKIWNMKYVCKHIHTYTHIPPYGGKPFFVSKKKLESVEKERENCTKKRKKNDGRIDFCVHKIGRVNVNCYIYPDVWRCTGRMDRHRKLPEKKKNEQYEIKPVPEIVDLKESDVFFSFFVHLLFVCQCSSSSTPLSFSPTSTTLLLYYSISLFLSYFSLSHSSHFYSSVFCSSLSHSFHRYINLILFFMGCCGIKILIIKE